jgi:hypothetical protein
MGKAGNHNSSPQVSMDLGKVNTKSEISSNSILFVVVWSKLDQKRKTLKKEPWV